MDDRIFETLGPGVSGPGVVVPNWAVRDRSISDTELESESPPPLLPPSAPPPPLDWRSRIAPHILDEIRLRSKAQAMARLHEDYRQRYGRPLEFKARL